LKLDILVELRDSPGQLSAMLGTCARLGGNVQSVLHEHGKKKHDWVPVRVVLEVPQGNADALIAALKEDNRVVSVGGAVNALPFAFLLLGHVFESQVNELTDAVFAAGATVRRFSAEISAREAPSAALVEISAPDAATLAEARSRVAHVAKAKGIVYVEALGGAEP
jgi:ACT domain-containing protein